MDNGVSLLIAYLVFIAIGIAITVIIMRAVFKIPTIVHNLEKQTSLLEDLKRLQVEILANQQIQDK